MRALPHRAVRAWIVAALALLVGASVGAAHGGFVVLFGTDGPYNVTVRASPVSDGGRSAVDLTSYVVGQRLGEPDLSARLTLRITGDGAPGEVRPQVVGDGYEAIVPVDRAGAWRGWRFEATVEGADGAARVVGAPPEEQLDDGPPGWLVPLSVALLAAGGALVWRRRRGSA